MIDAHCHLVDIKNVDFTQFSEMEAIVNSGYDVCSSSKAVYMKLNRAAGDVHLYANVGIGPQKCMGPDAMQGVREIEGIIRGNEKVIDAIGEVGLDYHWGDTEDKRRMQKQAFVAMIALAKELQKPIVIHSRQATAECIRILDEAKFEYGVMFHFFSGNLEEAKDISDRGWLVSLPPLRGGRISIARALDLESIAAETDAPYVGKTPLDVKESIRIIAEAKGAEFHEVEKCTSANVRRLFK
ncbi:MAG: TatD family hydrolase [Candidatus Micrarchaeia archaeon]